MMTTISVLFFVVVSFSLPGMQCCLLGFFSREHTGRGGSLIWSYYEIRRF